MVFFLIPVRFLGIKIIVFNHCVCFIALQLNKVLIRYYIQHILVEWVIPKFQKDYNDIKIKGN